MTVTRRHFASPSAADGDSKLDWLLGPDSVAWRILLTPWVPLIGGLRALAVEALEPLAMRGVVEHSDYLQRPLHRLRRTSAYVAATALGTVEEAERAARVVRASHRRVRGTDTVTGRSYSADDPATQVWVHVAQWYSYLVAHRVYVGDLSPQEEDRFIAEGITIATLVGTPAELVPSSVKDTRTYFSQMRPRLCLTDGAVDAIGLVTGRRQPSSVEQLFMLPAARMLGAAAAATIPHDLRRLMGIDCSRATDFATVASVRATLPLLKRVPITRMVSGEVGSVYFSRGRRAARVLAPTGGRPR